MPVQHWHVANCSTACSRPRTTARILPQTVLQFVNVCVRHGYVADCCTACCEVETDAQCSRPSLRSLELHLQDPAVAAAIRHWAQTSPSLTSERQQVCPLLDSLSGSRTAWQVHACSCMHLRDTSWHSSSHEAYSACQQACGYRPVSATGWQRSSYRMRQLPRQSRRRSGPRGSGRSCAGRQAPCISVCTRPFSSRC